jgi:flagellar hook-basal body protein
MDHKPSREMSLSGNLNSGAPVRFMEAVTNSFGIEDADENFHTMEYNIEKTAHDNYLFHFRNETEKLFSLNAMIDEYGQINWKKQEISKEGVSENTDSTGQKTLNWELPNIDPEASLQLSLALPDKVGNDNLGMLIEPVLTTKPANKPDYEADKKYFLSSVLHKGEEVQTISPVIDQSGQQHEILFNFEHVEKTDGKNVWKYSMGLGEKDPLIRAWLNSEQNKTGFDINKISVDDLQRANDALFGTERQGLLKFDENGFISNLKDQPELKTKMIATVTDPNSMIHFKPDFSAITAFSATTGLDAPEQDGYTAGDLTMSSVTSDGNGYLKGTYTNGEERYLGLFGLAVFKNAAGLLRENNNMFILGENTGFDEMTIGKPNSSTHGLVLPGFLELSNVNLTDEFTDLILTQRMFQANSKAITISDQNLTTAIQMKR